MKNNNCIKNLLRLILLLQRNSVSSNCLESGCSRAYLGPSFNFICYNTRVITLYRKDGISQEELSENLHIDKGTTCRAIKKLEEEGLFDKKYKKPFKISKCCDIIVFQYKL